VQIVDATLERHGEIDEITPAAAEQTPQAITPVGDQSKITLGHGLVVGALVVGAGFLAYALIGGFLRRRRENR